MSWQVKVVRNRYVDSVRLMKIAKDLRAHGRAEVMMGTPANLEALGVECDAGPGDIVIAVDGPADALEQAARELSAPPEAAAAVEVRPRTLRGGAANVALISVPGEYAALEAHRALTEGLHVFLFSDHVPVDEEVELKRRGAELGLLVMGPGCGTAMLGQVGLGFANVVRPGTVGIVAAAGTGAQEAAVLLDGAGAGVSHIIGVGGRDLSAEVGGIMFGEAMRVLDADDATETILLVSKPPARDVVKRLPDVGKRVVTAFVGMAGATIEAGAFAAAGAEPPDVSELEAQVDERRTGGRVLGLFSGGSLAHEALTILGDGHEILDLGEEEFTQGRPHPMIDLDVRLQHLGDADGDRCVLLDVVLGHGSHPDPAGGLAEALGRHKLVIAHVCGTDADPQDATRQEETLRAAGVVVAPTNAAAARLAARAVA
jgi:FdrA protein